MHTAVAQQQVRHLQRISEDLLTLSRLDNELQPPQMERIDWSKLIVARLELGELASMTAICIIDTSVFCNMFFLVL